MFSMSTSHSPLALITGASSGIGLATTHLLIKKGWRVWGLDVQTGAIESNQYTHHLIDLLNEPEVDSLIKPLLKLETPMAWIHAAGFLRTGHIGSLNLKDGTDMWQAHVQSCIQIGNQLIEQMKVAKQGRVVLISSRVWRGVAGRSQYAATKAALASLARSWASEMAPHAITVNAVSPAATDTPMLMDARRDGEPPRLPPIGRYIDPQEVAQLIEFLLNAPAITGQNIEICGGSSLA